MKEKILPFIIGLLVGAILATGGLYLCSKLNNNHRSIPGENPPKIMNQDGNDSNRGTPPEKPNGDNHKEGQMPSEKPANDSKSNANTDNLSTESNSNNTTSN